MDFKDSWMAGSQKENLLATTHQKLSLQETMYLAMDSAEEDMNFWHCEKNITKKPDCVPWCLSV